MRGQSEEINSTYSHEYRFLSWAKDILANHTLSADELFIEYGKLVDEYEALLAKLHQQNLPLGNLSPAEILETESRLFTGISHEFRTPLTLIISALEEMHSTCNDNGPKRKLSMMLRNAQRLFFILKQVLALSEIGRKELSLKTDRHDLITFLKGVIASFAVLAEENEIELILNAENQNIILYFDPEKMAEVICNLVMNALKYTPAGGQVKVSVHRSAPDAVVISVRDTGPGIPPAQLESIFDCYYHLNKPFELQKKGFGIGLYLVKEYITLHRGTIHVNSSEAEGTEFVIQLPVEKESLLPGEIETPPGSASRKKAGSEISARHAFMMRLEKEEARQPEDELTDIATNPRGRDIVLLVEDNADMRTFIKILLEKYYMVVAVETGREGIDTAKKMIPDIIVSDIIMPGIDGICLCRELKNNFNTSHIPIILLTARAADSEIIQGLQAGADDYIIKPFSVEVLLARIKNLVNLRRQLHEKLERRMRFQPEEISLSQLETLFLDKIESLIEENLSDPGFGVDQLATALDISRPTLYRKIFALTGQAPQKFIQSYRLKRSFELLKSQNGNVTEVAYKVGFSSSAYFTKCFKETFHRLPSDFQPF